MQLARHRYSKSPAGYCVLSDEPSPSILVLYPLRYVFAPAQLPEPASVLHISTTVCRSAVADALLGLA